MQPQSIYPVTSSNHPHREFHPRRAVVVVLGVLGATVLLAGAGVGFTALRQSGDKSSKGSSVAVSENGAAGTSPAGTSANTKKSPSANSGTAAGQTNNGASSAKTPTTGGSSSRTATGTASGTSSASPNSGSSTGAVNGSTPAPSAPTAPAVPQPTGDACGPFIKKSDGSNWRCVFNDDFDGTKINPNNWTVATSPNDFFQWFECYYDRSENVNVSNGKLYLTSRRENPQIPCGFLGGRDFSGGMVRTLNKFHLTRGKVDIRIQFPPSQGQYGIGTSLWMFHVPAPGGGGDAGVYGKWPASGEIDIAEQFAPFDDYVNPALHYNVKPGHKLQSSCGQEVYNAETVTARCLVKGATTGFHTYSVEWTTDTIAILYDGKLALVDKWDSTQGGTAPFDKPFYLNITQGFSNAPIPGPYGAVLPATAQVEYVKIWQ